MEFIKSFIDLFVHLDHHVTQLMASYGVWIYALLFLIIFAETGLVVTPFLPGDSLLFVLGALAAKGALHLEWLLVLLSIAAILGDTVNYAIGKMLAPKIFSHKKIPFLKEEHLVITKDFYAKYGAKTVVLARFVPLIRTFAPFMAGVASMPYKTFAIYNVAGGLLWVFAGLFAGYFFGNLPFVSENFSLVVLVIVVVSLIPAGLEFLKHKKHR